MAASGNSCDATSLQGTDNAEIVETVHACRALDDPVSALLRF
jgi:hypothetical protein